MRTLFTLLLVLLLALPAQAQGTGGRSSSSGSWVVGAVPALAQSLGSKAPSSGAWVAAAGRVEPVSEEMRLGFDIPGKILDVYVEEGDTVTKGQALARLVDADIQARFVQAQATVAAKQAILDRVVAGARAMERKEAAAALREAESVRINARREHDRRASLVAQGVISREEADRAEREYRVSQERVDQAKQRFDKVNDPSRDEDVREADAELALAQGQLAEAAAYLEKAQIRSPIDGVVLRKHRRAGEMVSTNFDSPVVTVGDVSKLRVRADVDEKDVARVQVGQRAYVVADAYGAQRFEGRVVRLARILGRKNIRTDDPAERLDTKVLEALVELDGLPPIPVGMRMDVFILLDGS